MITVRVDGRFRYGVTPPGLGGLRELLIVDESGVQIVISMDEETAKAIADKLLNPPLLTVPSLALLTPPGAAS